MKVVLEEGQSLAAPPAKITLDRQIAEVGREIGLRRNVYAGWVERGRMTQEESDDRIATMSAVYETLKWLQRHADTIRQAVTS